MPPRMAEFKKREGPDTWFTILEKAFIKLTSTEDGKRLYGDPEKGATLEQAWRTSGIISGKWPVCLVALSRPPVPTTDIEKLVKMNPQQLLKVLADIFGLSNHVAIEVLYYDGHTGHAITLLKYEAETSRFTYLDSWPGTSLLAKEYNAAGIDARHVEKQRWSITASELEKVIFAAFIFQDHWAEYLHEKYYVTYDELRNSDFWSFFHVTEKDRVLEQERDIDGENQQITVVTLRPGGFPSEIALGVKLDQRQRLKIGQISVKRSWLIGSPFGINPFAVDIVSSFIISVIPPPDQVQIQELLGELREIQNLDYAKKLLTEKREDSSNIRNALLAILGAVQSYPYLPLDFSDISITNLVLNDNVEWLQITITIDLV